MKVSNITFLTPISNQQRKSNINGSNISSVNNTIQNSLKPFAYQDFNISFTGRTPEDFYAQDFNRNNMPRTMREYLYSNYEFNQHIPPEQMMREVFKYLEIADNFADVKSIYPDEDLFKKLHENHQRARKSIFSEIKIAKELSDAPLFKDGSDDLGMYILRKIYLDGKTLKEINKDFQEKDINDEYIGVISKPIEYATLAAYGIDYPNNGFWHSFINTRDEYKKFFISLPKNTNIPGVNAPRTGGHSSGGRSAGSLEDVEQRPRKRKYTLKSHKRKEIEKDLINKKCPDEESIKKTVVKRFGKDDPEASFIVKYMSPIMTVAAQRAHMSEEIKAFSEFEQENGKVSNGRTMFERFWKHNPQMLEVFSAGVTDSIDMFEDIYGEGGLIPINTDLEMVTKKSENQKIIDYVNPEFLELLSYTQQIESSRNQRYLEHDELQKQWEAHFIDRYGDPNTIQEVPESSAVVVQPQEDELSIEERLKLEAERNNAKVYKLKTVDGEYVYVTSNIDEVLRDEIKNNTRYFPTKYAAAYIKATNKEQFSDRFKLTLAVRKIYEEAELDSTSDYDLSVDNAQLLPEKEFNDEFYNLVKFHMNNYKLERAARLAVLDTIILGNEIKVREPNMFDMSIFNLNEGVVEGDEKDVQGFKTVMHSSKKMIDRKYDYYVVPPTRSETNKIELCMLDMLSKYDPKKTILEDKTSVELITMLKEILPYDANKEVCKLFMSYLVKENPYTKSLLLKGIPDDMKQAKFEIIMDDLLHILIMSMKSMPNVVTMFNNDVYLKHKYNLSSDVQSIMDTSINRLNFDGRVTFYTPTSSMSPYNKLGSNFRPDNE